MAELSPMMRQYFEIKEKHQDCILMFRLGDFYEMFFDDAITASQTLGLTLTGRDCGLDERAPMCGVPFHSCDTYIARLLEAGFKIAICEQMENPAETKGLVKREVIRIITPGTVIEDSMLDEARNNYLASVCVYENNAAICFMDISTGSVQLLKIDNKDLEQNLINETGRLMPREVLVDSSIKLYPLYEKFLKDRLSCAVTILPDDAFKDGLIGLNVLQHFNKSSLLEMDLQASTPEVAAFDVAIKYVNANGMSGLKSINQVTSFSQEKFMRLDVNAMRNLELFETMRSKAKKGTLLWVLDKTKTAMGKRMLRTFLEQPLMNQSEIIKRQNAVTEIYNNTVLRGEIRELLYGINDVERLMTRIFHGSATAREMLSVSYTASKFGPIKNILSSVNSKYLKNIYDNIDALEDIINLIDDAIKDTPAKTIRDGDIIKDGYSPELDELRSALKGDSDFLTKIETEEKEKTGIKTLKVRYNKVFGYYIEVSKSFINMVPETYIRKQTLTNCERYITGELKELEGRILGAKDKAAQLEYEIFEKIRKQVSASLNRIQSSAIAVAKLDAICSLAEVAVRNNYVCPDLNVDGVISIKDGRHPVVEQLGSSLFVANDTLLDMKENRCAIITGPNMAGKSTYMRQVALITLLAQIGSYVPAKSANICIVDAIYTRVGASDDLASGQSTFMVEMSEVADIIKNATKDSLIIFDEIGRGTSTYDGMAIARSVLEYTCDSKKIGAKTLFATHYHELTNLEGELDCVKNYNIAVKKRGQEITFLRRIVRGGADKSYGIDVARLSGVPEKVITMANNYLKELETQNPTVVNAIPKVLDNDQMTFESNNFNEIIEELKSIDVNTLTPIEAMKKLYELSDKSKEI